MKWFRQLFLFLMIFVVAYSSLDLACLSEKETCALLEYSETHCDHQSSSDESDSHRDHCENHCTNNNDALIGFNFASLKISLEDDFFLSYLFSYKLIVQNDRFQPPKV